MAWFPRVVVGAFILVGISTVRAQVAQPQAATTVQLPTFSVFTVQTTVSVPDGGGAYLGGVGRGADGSVNRGPLRNRALGSARTAGGVSVSATIIDPEEIDRALLAEAAAIRGPSMDPVAAKKAASLSKALTRGDAASALPDSVAAIRARNAAAAEERAGELADYFAKARQAEAEGKIAVAKVYYQMVARRDAGQLKQQAQARLAALDGKVGAAAKR